MLQFFKYQGTGNDFIMVDDRERTFPVSQKYIEHLCHRRFGIGADGLILLQNADDYDFRMVYFNADGNEGSMCGNGGRCTVRFAQDLRVFNDRTTFLAVDGPHEATANLEEVSLKMMDVEAVATDGNALFLNTGSPHYVTFVGDVKATDVVGIGRAIRYGDTYGPKGGTNVNFVEIIDAQTLRVRTYERGVEDETYSCGTGVTACALAACIRLGMPSPVRVLTEGGTLGVSFETDGITFTNIHLIGPAVKVFEGKYGGK
ncbi:MAG: diaminopimelate epimerase [Spirosomaceae bacterium]|nr:diaminopimelate epimerase [Spirosomataceae bacterium]